MSVRHVGPMSDGLLETDLGIFNVSLCEENISEVAERLWRIDLQTRLEQSLLVAPVLIAKNSSGGGGRDHDEETEPRQCCQEVAAAISGDYRLVSEPEQQAETQGGEIEEPLRHHKTHIEKQIGGWEER